MKRAWTETTQLEWTRRRDAFRERKQLPPLEELRTSDDPKDRKAYEGALSAERRCLSDRLDAHSTKAVAWPLEKPPICGYPAPFAGTLYLPDNYHQTHGESKTRFRQGDDLNYIVYAFYEQKVDSDYPGVNYVARDGICIKRHEFLGPMPHVTGFQFSENAGTARIEWWDAKAWSK
ncbi:hypothetical protein PILCRDRAFT_745776 [Piloderma croceum F 1598]|uniref:Uncharacterized protein n=1 Tax=Piloderma croceum (strain F 1598) TaxID=765440 RepID=A0A0C3B4F3_PILCF|nr:hypothetical protein PILCRDRAFT_745776 [Piloderma croceum F 1598]